MPECDSVVPTPLEFRQLLDRARAGSPGAVNELVERYGPPLLRAVRRQMNRQIRAKFDSQDFVQDVWTAFFADAFQKSSFATPEDLTAFLARLARNKVIDALRQRLKSKKYNVNRERPLDLVSPPTLDLATADPLTPSQVVMREEEWDQLLRRLPPVHRHILTLYRTGLRVEAIARELGVSVRTVSRALDRARELG